MVANVPPEPRATGRCEACGENAPVRVRHLVDVAYGLSMGLSQRELDSDENQLRVCDKCNGEMGPEPMPFRVGVAVLRARLAWAEKERS